MSITTLDRLVPLVRRVARVGPDEPLAAETVLFGGGLSLDSVTALDLILAVEREFGIELDPDALRAAEALRDLGSFAAYVGALVGARG